MKFKKKLFISLFVLLTFVLSTASVLHAMDADAFSNPSYTYSSDGFNYKEANIVDGSNKQALFYGEYKADASSKYEWVIHSIRTESVTTKTTVMDIAKDYEEKTNKKVLFATNGDYFDLNSGSNMESYVNEGIVISKGSFATKHCMGFDNLGKSVVGRMTEVEKKLMLIVDGEKRLYTIDKFNQEPSSGEIAIYNNPGTYTLADCGKYIISSNSSNLHACPVWGTSKRMTTGEKTDSKSFTLKSGQFAVVVKTGEINDFFFDFITYGKEVNIVEIPIGAYENCSWVIGGYDILVDNGVVNTKPHTDNSGNVAAPRTFIGSKADGTFFLCVVDGRQSSYSVGITVSEEANLAKNLGAVNALELDGGGSSTVILRINDELKLRNKPSDGTMRKVSNAVLLVEKEIEEEELPIIDPTPGTDPEPVVKNGCSSDKTFESICATLSLASLIISFYVVNKMRKDI